MGGHVPDGGHRQPVDVAQLGQRDQLAFSPRARLDSASVDPVGPIGVTAYIEVLAQLLVADRATFGQQGLDLLEHERVALDRRRVMCLLEPDATPDALRLQRRGKTTQPIVQLCDLHAQTFVDGGPRWAPAPRRRRVARSGHKATVPNTSPKCSARAKLSVPNISPSPVCRAASGPATRPALPPGTTRCFPCGSLLQGRSCFSREAEAEPSLSVDRGSAWAQAKSFANNGPAT